MKRHFPKLAATILLPFVLVGCAGGGYQPAANDKQLVAYAAKASYPYTPSEFAPHLFATVAPDATITLFNAGDESYSEFEVWVNKVFTVHVPKLDSKSTVVLSPKILYNRSADTLENAPASSIATIQIQVPSTGKLLDVQGPILPH